MSPTIKEKLIDLLREYSDVFAWSYQDMLGLDTDIVVHRLPLREKCASVKQKTAYEIPGSDWSSDVCSSDLRVILVFIVLVPAGE